MLLLTTYRCKLRNLMENMVCKFFTAPWQCWHLVVANETHTEYACYWNTALLISRLPVWLTVALNHEVGNIWWLVDIPYWLLLPFCPNILGRWGGLWVVFCKSVSAVWAVSTIIGGWNTQTLISEIKPLHWQVVGDAKISSLCSLAPSYPNFYYLIFFLSSSSSDGSEWYVHFWQQRHLWTYCS